MTNSELLKKAVEDSGITKSFIADKMNISRTRLYKILDGGECTVSEMLAISGILGLSAKQRSDIFFTTKVV